MPAPKKEIFFSIDSLFDMQFNIHVKSFYSAFEELVDDGFILKFGRGNEVLTRIEDKNHLEKFINSLNLM